MTTAFDNAFPKPPPPPLGGPSQITARHPPVYHTSSTPWSSLSSSPRDKPTKRRRSHHAQDCPRKKSLDTSSQGQGQQAMPAPQQQYPMFPYQHQLSHTPFRNENISGASEYSSGHLTRLLAQPTPLPPVSAGPRAQVHHTGGLQSIVPRPQQELFVPMGDGGAYSSQNGGTATMGHAGSDGGDGTLSYGMDGNAVSMAGYLSWSNDMFNGGEGARRDRPANELGLEESRVYPYPTGGAALPSATSGVYAETWGSLPDYGRYPLPPNYPHQLQSGSQYPPLDPTASLAYPHPNRPIGWNDTPTPPHMVAMQIAGSHNGSPRQRVYDPAAYAAMQKSIALSGLEGGGLGLGMDAGFGQKSLISPSSLMGPNNHYPFGVDPGHFTDGIHAAGGTGGGGLQYCGTTKVNPASPLTAGMGGLSLAQHAQMESLTAPYIGQGGTYSRPSALAPTDYTSSPLAPSVSPFTRSQQQMLPSMPSNPALRATQGNDHDLFFVNGGFGSAAASPNAAEGEVGVANQHAPASSPPASQHVASSDLDNSNGFADGLRGSVPQPRLPTAHPPRQKSGLSNSSTSLASMTSVSTMSMANPSLSFSPASFEGGGLSPWEWEDEKTLLPSHQHGDNWRCEGGLQGQTSSSTGSASSKDVRASMQVDLTHAKWPEAVGVMPGVAPNVSAYGQDPGLGLVHHESMLLPGMTAMEGTASVSAVNQSAGSRVSLDFGATTVNNGYDTFRDAQGQLAWPLATFSHAPAAINPNVFTSPVEVAMEAFLESPSPDPHDDVNQTMEAAGSETVTLTGAIRTGSKRAQSSSATPATPPRRSRKSRRKSSLAVPKMEDVEESTVLAGFPALLPTLESYDAEGSHGLKALARGFSKGKAHAVEGGVFVCDNCGETETPMWRRNELNELLCNACGLYHRTHAAHRPLTAVQAQRDRRMNLGTPNVPIKRKKKVAFCTRCKSLSTEDRPRTCEECERVQLLRKDITSSRTRKTSSSSASSSRSALDLARVISAPPAPSTNQVKPSLKVRAMSFIVPKQGHLRRLSALTGAGLMDPVGEIPGPSWIDATANLDPSSGSQSVKIVRKRSIRPAIPSGTSFEGMMTTR